MFIDYTICAHPKRLRRQLGACTWVFDRSYNLRALSGCRRTAAGFTTRMPATEVSASKAAPRTNDGEPRDAPHASDPSTALYSELQQIKALARQHLELQHKEEQKLESTQAILRVVLTQLQSGGQSQSTEADLLEPSGEDINIRVRSAQRDAAALVEIIQGISSEAQFQLLEDDSVSTLLPALCDSINAELDKDIMSLRDVLRKLAALIMFVDYMPETTNLMFEKWGAAVVPLAEKLLVRSRSTHLTPCLAVKYSGFRRMSVLHLGLYFGRNLVRTGKFSRTYKRCQRCRVALVRL